jgi:hypothetical protein
MRVADTAAVCGAVVGLSLFSGVARADGPPTTGKAITSTYEIENLDAHAELAFVVWPRSCNSNGSPLGSVDLALNPDWSARLHEVDYEVLEKGKKHELSPYCVTTARLYALPVAAFRRASRDAGADDRQLGQTVGAPHIILPALDAIDLKRRVDFFASDPRALRSTFRFDFGPVISPSPLEGVHDILALEGFDAASFKVLHKRAVYTYRGGVTEALASTDGKRPPPSQGDAGASATASSAAALDAGAPAVVSTAAGDAQARVDRGTRWVYMAAVGGLIAGGVLAYLRKKRESR